MASGRNVKDLEILSILPKFAVMSPSRLSPGNRVLSRASISGSKSTPSIFPFGPSMCKNFSVCPPPSIVPSMIFASGFMLSPAALSFNKTDMCPFTRLNFSSCMLFSIQTMFSLQPAVATSSLFKNFGGLVRPNLSQFLRQAVGLALYFFFIVFPAFFVPHFKAAKYARYHNLFSQFRVVF